MKQGIKTVRFMVIVSVVFITVLATVNEATKARIEQNLEIEKAKSMLYAFNIFPEGVKEGELSLTTVTADVPWKEGDVLSAMEARLQAVTIPIPEELQDEIAGTFLDGQSSVKMYESMNEQGEVIAYGLPLYGKGLWGTIEGFGVISANLDNMLGIDFTKQVETPGLGARIIEKEYKYFFRNLDLSGFHDGTNQTPIIMVKKKESTNVENSTNSVQSITGATQTSQGVLDMINSNLALYIRILKGYKEQG